jgi:hypothetical protein
MLAHNNSVAVSSHLLAVTPFIHLLHQAHFRLVLLLVTLWLLVVVVEVDIILAVVALVVY